MAGLATSFGSGAMTNAIGEIRNAACLFVIGSNTTTAHPIIARQMKYAVRDGATLILANPLETGLREHAAVFLQHLPGTDVALLMGMMKFIVDNDLLNRDFIRKRCDNFDAFKASLCNFPLDFVEKTTQVKKETLKKAAQLFAEKSPAGIFYAMGITQHTHGTDNVTALANLALLTGNLGKPATGVNPLRGQNNVQGACDMGGLPGVFPGYQKVDIPKIRKKFETAWSVQLPATPGITHTEIIDRINANRIKALYIIGENPLLSEADATHTKKAFETLPFLVVQDIFLTETAQKADVILPSTTFAEKEGTFTNTERRVQWFGRAIMPRGRSRPDHEIVCDLAGRMGASGFDFQGPEEIMQEIASLVPQYKGITYARLGTQGLQWPCPDKNHPGTPFLYEKNFATPNGRGKFVPLSYTPPAELPDRTYPFILTTGRSLYHFHTDSMTGRVNGLKLLHPCERLEMGPSDAKDLGVETGTMVTVTSRRGKVRARVFVTRQCPPGVVNMTFHFASTPTNLLTNRALDPVAKIPETKICAVKISPAKGMDK